MFLHRETPVGYALLKAKSSKILNGDGVSAEDQTAEGICDLYVYQGFQDTFFAVGPVLAGFSAS